MTAPTPPPTGGGLTASSLLTGVLDLLKRYPVPLLLPLVILGILGSGGGGGPLGPGPEMEFDLDGGGPAPWEIVPFLAFFGILAIFIAVLMFVLYLGAWLVTTDAALPAAAGDEAPDLGASFRRVFDRLAGGLWTGVLGGVLVTLGFFALVIPGLIMMVGWAPWAAVVLREGRTGFDALGRSWELTRGHRLDLFLLFLAGFGVSLAAGLFVGWLPIVGNVLASAVGGAVTAAYAVMGALYYVRRTATPAAPSQPQPPSEGPAADEGY